MSGRKTSKPVAKVAAKILILDRQKESLVLDSFGCESYTDDLPTAGRGSEIIADFESGSVQESIKFISFKKSSC